jgi:hypothetical protein
MGLSTEDGGKARKNDAKVLLKRLKQAEREIMRLQRERDMLVARRKAEVDALSAQLAEAVAARAALVAARDEALALLEREREEWRRHSAQMVIERDRAVSVAERKMAEAFGARDDALALLARVRAECEQVVHTVKADRDAQVAAAHAERDAALQARDHALVMQRQAECMSASSTMERDRAVDGWARAEAQLKGGAGLAQVLPSAALGVAPLSDGAGYMPRSSLGAGGGVGAGAASGPSPGYPAKGNLGGYTRPLGLDDGGDDPRAVATPTPTGQPAPSPLPSHMSTPSRGFGAGTMGGAAGAGGLDSDHYKLLLKAVINAKGEELEVRAQACRALTYVADPLVDSLATALMSGAEWPVRAPPQLEGERSKVDWVSVPVPEGCLGTDSTLQHLSPVGVRLLQRNYTYSLVGSVVDSRESSRQDQVGCVRPFRVYSGVPGYATDPRLLGDKVILSDGSVTGGATSAVSFLAAVGGSVVVLKGLVPQRDSDSSVELFLATKLDQRHHNLVAALHTFVGSSSLIRPWVTPSLLALLPSHVQYLVLPHYPLSLRSLAVARRASGRPALTELEVLLVCTQVLSALGHLLDSGYVHRNVSVSVPQPSTALPSIPGPRTPTIPYCWITWEY